MDPQFGQVPSPVPPVGVEPPKGAGTGESPSQKLVFSIIVAVAIMVLLWLMFGGGGEPRVPADTSSTALNSKEKILARVGEAEASPLLAEEKADIVNFVSDPRGAQTLNEDEAARLIEELRRDGSWEWKVQ